MKKTATTISPYILLTLPVLILIATITKHAGSEVTSEKIQVAASFIQLPNIDVFQVLQCLGRLL